ncbi:hypothetical protein FS749_015838 [Ceratobasidium sp. UAMH 11750]|nr:hypothetical protein FS749_015838 [Ceratobasidium sp. UAMH 11750]
MLLRAASLLALPRVHALPVIDVRALGTRDGNTGGNKASAQIIVPVVLAVVFFLMLLFVGWWRRRRRMRQAVTDIRNNSSTANTNTPATSGRTNNDTRTPITAPGTGPDAPPRPQRRRRRRRPSQISTKSLPAYNEEAGDEEIVLVRRSERDSMSDDDDYEGNGDGRDSTHENSRSMDATPLLDDASPEMGEISLASSTRGRSIGDHGEQDSEQHPARADTSNDISISVSTTEDATNDTTVPPPNTEGTSATNVPLGDAPSYDEAIHTTGEAGATQEMTGPENGQSSQTPAVAASSTTTPGNAAESDAFNTLQPKRKSVFRRRPPSAVKLDLYASFNGWIRTRPRALSLAFILTFDTFKIANSFIGFSSPPFDHFCAYSHYARSYRIVIPSVRADSGTDQVPQFQRESREIWCAIWRGGGGRRCPLPRKHFQHGRPSALRGSLDRERHIRSSDCPQLAYETFYAKHRTLPNGRKRSGILPG